MVMRRKGYRADFSPNFSNAIRALGLTRQEQYLYRHHLHNLSKGGVVNPDQSISTLYQTTMGYNGRHYNIPTVWDNQILDEDQSRQRALQTGIENFPSYPSAKAADARYQDMHKYLEKDMADWFRNIPGPPRYPPFKYGLGPGNELGE